MREVWSQPQTRYERRIIMKKVERIKMVKAMEFICRNLNNEEIFCDYWLTDGVADGDIEYGDLAVKDEDFDEYSTAYWIEDERFAELMKLFLVVMAKAKRDGGLYCDNVVSK